jgi:SAM-dependent methyltransferase
VDPQQRAVADEFNKYHSTYDQAVNKALAFSGLTVDAFMRAKSNDLARFILERVPDHERAAILDVGCGVGNYHPTIGRVVGSLTGVDVSEACIATARSRNPGVTYDVYEGKRLPYPDAAFALAYAVCVLHHVPPAGWSEFAGEMARVVRPGGWIVVYEHNPHHPLTRKVVRDCEFDRDAVLLTRSQMRRLFTDEGCREVEVRSILTLPPGGGLISRLDRALAWLPMGTQYRVTSRI